MPEDKSTLELSRQE